jgi:hypothetical protein
VLEVVDSNMFKEDAIKMIRIAQQKPKRENLVERERETMYTRMRVCV